MQVDANEKLTEETRFLSGFILEKRKNRVEEVLNFRTRYLTVLLEDIYQSQNASAVLRTCDSTGIQDVHIIENKNDYRVNPLVTQGADKWLTLNRFNKTDADNTTVCLQQLKSKGYRLVATTLENYSHTPESIPLEQPLAFAFGNEKEGLCAEIINHADFRMKIPMFGFSQSFNISVSAAIILYTVITRLHASRIKWQLQPGESAVLRLEWYQKITGIKRFS